jgi:hypothetical protein
MPRIPNIPPLLGRRPPVSEPAEFGVHLRLELELEDPTDQENLENASLRLLEVVEKDAADIALGPVSGCNFSTGEIDIEFTVMAARSSELHEKISRVVKVIESVFPTARERSSETEAAAPREPVPA